MQIRELRQRNKHSVVSIIDLITLASWFILLETGWLDNMKDEMVIVASVHVAVQPCRAFASENLSSHTLYVCVCARVHVCFESQAPSLSVQPEHFLHV